MSEVEVVVKCCNDKLKLDNAKLSDEYHYQSLSLCVIDAVFSIGVRYTSTRQTVIKYCDFYGMKRIRNDFSSLPVETEQESISQLIDKIEYKGIEEFTNEVFKNRQRTSTCNGILKTEAVLKFAKILKEFNVEYLQDLVKIINNDKFEEEIKKIPGQKSGISLTYFFMLAGSSDFIKPDRMIIRFLENALNRKVQLEEARRLLSEASKILKVQFQGMTPRILDHQIWREMSSTK
jgi:hypothetical protein